MRAGGAVVLAGERHAVALLELAGRHLGLGVVGRVHHVGGAGSGTAANEPRAAAKALASTAVETVLAIAVIVIFSSRLAGTAVADGAQSSDPALQWKIKTVCAVRTRRVTPP